MRNCNKSDYEGDIENFFKCLGFSDRNSVKILHQGAFGKL